MVMYWLETWLALTLLFLVSFLNADPLPYFEEQDRLEIPGWLEGVSFKITSDGRYLLVNLANTYNDKYHFINIHSLQLNEGKIDKNPASSILYDGFNNPFTWVSGIALTDTDRRSGQSSVYVYSVTKETVPLVSAYRLNASGIATSIDRSFPMLLDGPPEYTHPHGANNIEIHKSVMFVASGSGVAVAHINLDGSLVDSGQRLPLPGENKQPGSPGVLMYEPGSRRLFLGLDCDSGQLCEEHTYLAVYSFRKNSYSNPSMIYSSFDNNASCHRMAAALSQSRGKKPMVVMGMSGHWEDIDHQSDDPLAAINVIDPVSLQTAMCNMSSPVHDLAFSVSDDRIYVSNDKGLSAYNIAPNLSLTPVAQSDLTTSFNHFTMELTPDGCHLLTIAKGQSEGEGEAGYLILYRINDARLNCVVPPSYAVLELSVSIPATFIIMAGLTMAVCLVCYQVRKYGARKGYVPVND